MDSNYLSRFSRNHSYRQRTQQKVNPIVDDTTSSNPHSLLPWLKRNLKLIHLANSPHYNPTLPPAA